jgi:hypothetical protein
VRRRMDLGRGTKAAGKGVGRFRRELPLEEGVQIIQTNWKRDGEFEISLMVELSKRELSKGNIPRLGREQRSLTAREGRESWRGIWGWA